VLGFRNGSRFKSEEAGQLRISPTMGWQLTPFRHKPRPREDRATAAVATKDHGYFGLVPEGASPKEPENGGQPRGGRQPNRSRSQLISRRLAILRGTWPRGQWLPRQTKNPGTSMEANKTLARKRTRQSPMLTHETSPVLGASVMGMTNGACHGPSNLLAGILGISTTQG
jgi:hypothetical protein